MKKVLALVLALTLCLSLGLSPAFAEDELTGTWYLRMLGLTTGSIELNEDGSCVLNVSADEGQTTTEGSWTKDGDQIVLTVDDNTMPLIYDGENLILDGEGIAELGMSMEGMDDAMMSMLLLVSREPGVIPMDEFSAYQEDGTLPEGKTEEEMESIVSEFMMNFFALLGFGDDGSFSDYEEGEAAELTVLEDNFYVRDSYGYQEAVYIAKVQNDNDEPVYLSEVSLTVKDADGQDANEWSYQGASFSRYLEPGEATFISVTADLNEGAAAESYETSMIAYVATYQDPDLTLDVEAGLRINEEEYYTEYRATATVTNATEEPMAGINSAIAVRDADGKLMDVVSASLDQNELAPDSTITFVGYLNSVTVEYCEANGLTLSQAEAFAWAEKY